MHTDTCIYRMFVSRTRYALKYFETNMSIPTVVVLINLKKTSLVGQTYFQILKIFDVLSIFER